MTTQASNTTIGNSSVSRVFNVTATDGQYNNATDTVSSTALGLALPGVTINFIQSTYAAGVGVWRIISSQTNVIKRQGFMSVTAYANPSEGMIVPYQIQPDDLFQVYTDIADATSNQSTVLALITSSVSVEAFTATNIVDATSTVLTSLISGLGVGDLLFGKTITQVAVQEEDGGTLGNITFIDAAGGTQYTAYGSKRLPTAGGQSNLTNGVFNVSIPVQKGWSLKVKVTSA